jgi:hypothetical protein
MAYAILILDAVVTHQTKTDFGMLLPYGGRDLLRHASDNGMCLIFRHSIAPSDPVAIAPAAEKPAKDTQPGTPGPSRG